MCGIGGFVKLTDGEYLSSKRFEEDVSKILIRTAARGPDSGGMYVYRTGEGSKIHKVIFPKEPMQFDLDPFNARKRNQLIQDTLYKLKDVDILMTNFRGIPTTENFDWGSPEAIQPFNFPGDMSLAVAHNGLLNNDTQLYHERDWTPVMPGGRDIDSYAFLQSYRQHAHDYMTVPVFVGGHPAWQCVLEDVKGSFAVTLLDKANNLLHFARNFLGLYFAIYEDRGNIYLLWASEAAAFDSVDHLGMIEMPMGTAVSISTRTKTWNSDSIRKRPYRILQKIIEGCQPFDPKKQREGAIVVLSGGLDSTTAAAWAVKKYETVHLVHYHYGALAEGPETAAVRAIHQHFVDDCGPDRDVRLEFLSLDVFKQLGGSTLTDPTRHGEIAEGEAGIERANEWVPFRNGVMLATAAAYADRHDLGTIILGLNREEAGSFSDNSQEFYSAWETVLATGARSQPRVVMPLGNLMKHHIYAMALELQAPIHLSWSCYRAGEKHCGHCGPCHLRLRAAKMSGVKDNIEYESYPSWYAELANEDHPAE